MKRTKQTALTAAVFAAAIGVSFTGSIPAEADTARYLAATDQSDLQVLYGPGPDFFQYPDGDMNGDEMLDARDLSLMKQLLLLGDRSRYTRTINFFPDSAVNGTDARVLMYMLTGEFHDPKCRPHQFRVYFRPVPFFMDETPETDAERLALVHEAECRLEQIENSQSMLEGTAPLATYFCERTQKDMSLGEGKDAHPTWFNIGEFTLNGHDIWLNSPDGFAPNEFRDETQDDTDIRCLHRTKIRIRMPFDEQFDPAAADSAVQSLVLTEFSGSFPTYIQKTDGSEEYYDKLLLEWDVNTGRFRMHDALTVKQAIPKWSALKDSDFYG